MTTNDDKKLPAMMLLMDEQAIRFIAEPLFREKIEKAALDECARGGRPYAKIVALDGQELAVVVPKGTHEIDGAITVDHGTPVKGEP